MTENTPSLKKKLEGSKRYLQNADLKGADLEEADLERALLVGADLRGANLKKIFLDENLFQ